jgi:thymidylate kinase
MDNNEKGKLIVIYGINSLGKTTQAKMLVESLIIRYSKRAEYLKYPVYTLEPTGPLLNNYLKGGNPNQFTSREFQLMQVINRTQYQNTIQEKLDKGIWIVAEDYVGTGIAWGMADNLDKKLLFELNSHLIKEDLGILFEGTSFANDLDKENIHESNLELLQKAATAFKEISNDFGWNTLNANQEKEVVQEEVMNIVKSKLNIID